MLPENTLADAEKWAARLAGPGYAIDDQTAIQVAGGTVEVISEGHWKLFTHEETKNLLLDALVVLAYDRSLYSTIKPTCERSRKG